MAYEPETLEEALAELEKARAEIETMQEEIDDLGDDLRAAEDERNSAQSELDDIKGTPELREAAELLMSETARPVGKIRELQLPDTDHSRRALLMLSDALGRHIP